MHQPGASNRAKAHNNRPARHGDREPGWGQIARRGANARIVRFIPAQLTPADGRPVGVLPAMRLVDRQNHFCYTSA